MNHRLPTVCDIEAARQRFPIGTEVRYWSGAKQGEPTGTGTVEGEPYMFGTHTLCAYIRGKDGGHDHIAVTNLETYDPTDDFGPNGFDH